MIVDDAVNVDVSEKPDLDQLVLKRFKHLVGELRALCYHKNGAHLARSRADLSWHELLVLEVLFPPAGEPVAPHITPYSELRPWHKVL